MTINLGAAGVYTSGGYSLTTNSQNLGLTAASVAATDNDSTVFAVGSGSFTVSAAAQALFTAGSTKYWNYDPTAAANGFKGSTEILAGDPTAVGITKWKFYGSSVTPVTEAGTAWMNGGSLAAGKVVQVETPASVTKAGLTPTKDSGGNVKYRITSSSTTTSTVRSLTGSRDITFVSVGASGAGVTVAEGVLPNATSVLFSGVNYFNGDLTLNATGSISQTTGAGNTLSVSGGKLIVTGSSGITLANNGNTLGSLGPLTSSGAVSIASGTNLSLTGTVTAGGTVAITTTAAMNLTGNITSVGAITLTATGLTLGSSITTDGGAVTIALGATGIYASGSYSLTTTNQNLSLTAASVTAAADDATVFVLGTGSLTESSGTRAIVTAGTTKYYDFGWTPDNQNSASEIGTVNPNDPTLSSWKFYGSTVQSADRAPANNTVWMNGATLAAGKVVRVVSTAFVSTAGLDQTNVAGGNRQVQGPVEQHQDPDRHYLGRRSRSVVRLGRNLGGTVRGWCLADGELDTVH